MDHAQATAPQIDLTTEGSEKKKAGRWIAGIGVALFAGPIWGMVGTVVCMIRAFNTLAENEAASSEVLSQDISVALVSSMIGILVGIVGSALIFAAFFAFKNREKWFFWWSVGIAVFWCLTTFPFGLIFALPIAILFLAKRSEFREPTKI